MAAWVYRTALAAAAVAPCLIEVSATVESHESHHARALALEAGATDSQLMRREGHKNPDSALETKKGSTLIRYVLHSKGKACSDGSNNGTFLWEGTDAKCRSRCSSTADCLYFTSYRGDYCELSASCRRLVEPRDASAVTFSSLTACDGELKVEKCEHVGGTVVNPECNDISKPCVTGNRPCFKLYDTDDTGLAGRNGTKVQILLSFPKLTRVTRLDSIGSFKNNFTLASRLNNLADAADAGAEAADWSALAGSFLPDEKGQTVGEVGQGVTGTQFRITWEDTEDAKHASWPGAKLFLRGC